MFKYKQTISDGSNEWLKLIKMSEDCTSEQLEEIANEFAKQIKKDLNDRQNATDCAYNMPRIKSHIDKKNGIAHMIANKLFPIDTNEEKTLEVRKKHCYIQYSKVRAQLRHIFITRLEEIDRKEQEEKDKKKQLMFQRKNFCTLKNRPLSTKITQPEAMPVDIADIKELEPFFEYMKKNIPPDSKNFMEFTRGVFYNDGRIDMCKQVVGHLWINNLMDSIRYNEEVKHFLLGNNIIGLDGAKAISNFLTGPHVPKIKTWYIAGNMIDTEGIKLIAEAFKNENDATSLWLKRNPLQPEGIKYLGEMLEVNETLRILDLHNTAVLDEGVGYLFKSLEKNTTLRQLYLDANGITKNSVGSIINYFDYLIRNNLKGITSLWIDMNRLDDEGTVALVDTLQHYHHLKRLVIGSNRITGNGAKEILGRLKHHPKLMVLDIGLYKSTFDMDELPNDIGDAGVQPIVDFITNNKGVKVFSILHNNISLDGLKRIAEAVQYNHTLLKFYFHQFGVDIDKETENIILNKINENIKNNLGISPNEFALSHLRNLKHSKEIRYIDSIYRNRMK